MIKKIIAAALFMAMLSSVSYAEDNDFAWAEAENAFYDNFTEADDVNASNEKLLTIYDSANGGRVDVELSIPENDDYDIWILSTPGDARNCSKFKWSVNDGDINSYQSTDEIVTEVYDHKLSVSDYKLLWSRVAVNVPLNQGENTFSYIIDSKSSGGARRYCAMLDCVVAVPNSMSWQPKGDLKRPEKVSKPFSWIELEKPSNETIIGTASSSEASGGYMLSAYALAPQNDDGTGELLTYNFTTDTEEEYDIWYLGSASYASATHLSGMYWDIDSEPEKNDSYRDNNQQTGDTILHSSGGTSDIPMYWRKLGTKYLELGKHSLQLKYFERTLDDSGRYFLWADCAVIIPKSYNWEPTVNTSEVLPDYDAAYLDAKFVSDLIFSGEYSRLTGNIAIPENAPVSPNGSSIEIHSDNPDVISDRGEVTQPFYDEEDVNTGFTVTAEHNGKRSEIKIPMCVVKKTKYNIGKIEFENEQSDAITDLNGVQILNAKTNISLNVSANSDLKGKAALVLALYDNNGALISIDITEKEITKNDVELNTSLAITDGYKFAKAFVINGMKSANELCSAETIE